MKKKALVALLLAVVLVLTLALAACQQEKYIVGAYIDDNGHLVAVFSDKTEQDLGLVKGADGAQGAKGETGAQGAQGIQGPKGDTGTQGPKGDTGAEGPKGDTGTQGPKGDTGAQGEPGADGKSAYELWKEVYGFDGTEAEWLKALAAGELNKIKTVSLIPTDEQYSLYCWSLSNGVLTGNRPEGAPGWHEIVGLQYEADDGTMVKEIPAGTAFTFSAVISANPETCPEWGGVGMVIGYQPGMFNDNEAAGGYYNPANSTASHIMTRSHWYETRINNVVVNQKWGLNGQDPEPVPTEQYGKFANAEMKFVVSADGTIKSYIDGVLIHTSEAGAFQGGPIGFFYIYTNNVTITNIKLIVG